MIDRPEISWREGGTPEAVRFSDIYFSPEDGIAETTHVFLKGIGAPEVWLGRDRYVVAETGFGTGLNFLCAWELFERTAAPGARLHFISVEGFPLSVEDLSKALSAFPELSDKAEALRSVYPPLQPGYHRLTLGDGRITLTLLFGPVEEMLSSASFEADAWFLDGFAPSRNPGMWSDEVLAHVARLTRPGGRVASFTVAGSVRRGLEAGGFRVEKKPGFGRKRDCLAGRLLGRKASEGEAPWFQQRKREGRPQKVAIIGAGIAGCCVASALAREGVEVHVFERWDFHAQEGSGNPAAMMNPRMSLGRDADALFRAQAYVHAISFYDRMEAEGRQVWKARCGAFQLAGEKRDEAHQARLVAEGGLPEGWIRSVSAKEASKLTGVEVPRGGLYVEHGGFLDPDRLCAELLSGVTFHGNSEIASLERTSDGWCLVGAGGDSFEAEEVVLANALGSAEFGQTLGIPFGPNRGQLTLVPASEMTQELKSAISFDGYISPAFEVEEGLVCHLVGATYDRPDSFDMKKASDIRVADHERNLKALEGALGGAFAMGAPGNFRGRAAVRCTTPDRLPLIGEAPVSEAYQRLYHDIHHGRETRYFPAAYHDGLYILAGFGSRGFQYAPLAAEVLVAEMFGSPAPIPEAVRQALHPARFLMRDLRRRTWAANGPKREGAGKRGRGK